MLRQVGQAAIYGGGLLQVLIGIAWFRAGVGAMAARFVRCSVI